MAEKKRKSYAAAYVRLGALAKHQPREIRERRTAAEEAYGAVRARLGAAGTYDIPGAAPGAPAGPGGAAPTETTPGIMGTKTFTKKDWGELGIDPRYTTEAQMKDFSIQKVDKNALLGQLEGSTEFRIASRLTAEAEQLVAREGPLWNEMVKNTQLPILEGFGAAARENAEAIRKAIQKGGSARREGMAAMVQMQEQAKLNSARVSQIAESRVALDKWARENARTQLEFNESWASNVAGVRESYNSAMDRASELMLGSAIPIMFESTKGYIEQREGAHAQQRAKVGQWISGAIAVGSLVAGGAGALAGAGLLGAGAMKAASVATMTAGALEKAGGKEAALAGTTWWQKAAGAAYPRAEGLIQSGMRGLGAVPTTEGTE